MSTAIPKKVDKKLRERSGEICEGCGLKPATERHHRLYRSRGGKHTIENLLHLCGWGNHTGCHGVAHSGAQGVRLGWAVNTGGNPLLVPVMYRGVSSFLLFCGRVEPVGEVVF